MHEMATYFVNKKPIPRIRKPILTIKKAISRIGKTIFRIKNRG
jgi:hypothetical protein